MTHFKILGSRQPVKDTAKPKYKSCTGSGRRGTDIYCVGSWTSNFTSGAPVFHPLVIEQNWMISVTI